jgi:DNA repair protein RecN (Recombination protein N)
VNCTLCTASQVAEIAEDLCDIASQHESVSLTDAATHGGYLDAFARLEREREEVAGQFDELDALSRELESATSQERGRAEREDFMRWQLTEIGELDPQPGEEVALQQERARLRHAHQLESVTRQAADRLYESEGAICDVLGRLASELEQGAAIDGSLAIHARVVESARSELADTARALARYAESVDASPERLAEVEDRAFRLERLLRKYGPSTNDLLAHRDGLARELEALSGGPERITLLEREKANLLVRLGESARALSRKRRRAADALSDAIGRELSQMGMGRARVIVEVAPTAVTTDAPAVDGAKLTRTGIDRVEFLIAPNRGEEPRPLRKIASGGELSRALLALKRVLADQGPAGMYVFDEVDAGVSGATAEVIGRAIRDIARHRQVVCITHLAQIAALADTHFVVSKSESRGRTQAAVRRIAGRERVEEIARMIGGIRVSDAARQAAQELLGERVAG